MKRLRVRPHFRGLAFTTELVALSRSRFIRCSVVIHPSSREGTMPIRVELERHRDIEANIRASRRHPTSQRPPVFGKELGKTTRLQ
jgi:hypothetical protein